MLRKLIQQIAFCLLAIFAWSCFAGHPSILDPKGVVAFEERKIIFDTAALMLIVVIPVIVMSIVFVIHYRKGNMVEEYKPNWHHSVFLESLWWGLPLFIVTLLAIITWFSTHRLDPFRKLHYNSKLLHIKVVALPWKWLFIYDDQKITTVNKLVLPKKMQVEFSLTSDNVPMSAFFIPQLGSQIYTMAGMETKLHLIPTRIANIEGFNAQYNGYGFDQMRFPVEVIEKIDFDKWVQSVKNNAKPFTKTSYLSLRQPSYKNNKSLEFSGIEPGLFKKIIHSYMHSEHPKGTEL